MYLFNSKSNFSFSTKPILMFSMFSLFKLSVSVFTVVPSLVVGADGTESLFITGVSLYVFVLYSNSTMYFPVFKSLNSYLPSLSVIAVISSPASFFRYSATLSLLICFIFTKIPFSNFSFSPFIFRILCSPAHDLSFRDDHAGAAVA